eukprot:m.44770 g.44770  ORF g.44770 m.44770 type:complete len:1243 (+) comp5842_c0_seq1:74-3802(+)
MDNPADAAAIPAPLPCEQLLRETYEALSSEPDDIFGSESIPPVFEGLADDQLADFTAYIVTLRYGHEDTSRALQSPGNSLDMSKHELLKSQKAERVLQYLLMKMPFRMGVLLGCHRGLLAGADQPLQRKMAVSSGLDYALRVPAALLPAAHATIKDLIELGCRDVWSAVRSACASRTAPLLERMTLGQLERVYELMFRICSDAESTWQAAEGSLQVMAAALRCFTWKPRVLVRAGSDSADERGLDGDDEAFALDNDAGDYALWHCGEPFNALPPFMEHGLRPALYRLLAHPQLGIREQAGKVFSAYLSRSRLKIALLSLREIISRLRVVPNPHTPLGPVADSSDDKSSDTHLNAYEAEGLLGVLDFIIKHLKPGFLLAEWPLYHSTLEHYLWHPASTVRQATSTVFKFIVARDSTNPIIAKLVLQGLAAGCAVTRGNLLGTSLDSVASRRASILQPGDSDDSFAADYRISDTWEWREGRLLTYELVLSVLVANHVHVLFPSTAVRRSTDVQIVARRRLTPSELVLYPHHTPTPSPMSSSSSLSRVRSFEIKRSSVSPFPASLRRESSTPAEPISPMSDAPSACSQSLRSSPDGPAFETNAVTPAVPSTFKRLTRQTSSRTHSLQKHIASAATSTPQEVFLPRPTRSSDVLGLSLIAHLQACDLADQPQPPSPAEFLRELDVVLRLPLVHLSFTEPARFPAPHEASKISALASLPELDEDEITAAMASSSLGRDADGSYSPPPTPTQTAVSPSRLAQLKLPTWVDTSLFVPFTRVLWHILLQTADSMQCSQFELRRISSMVLPNLTEVMRWYDPTCLEVFWRAVLTTGDSWMSHIALLTMRQSLSHVSWLTSFFQASSMSSRMSNSGYRASAKMSEMLNRVIPTLVPIIVSHAKDLHVSRLSVGAVEVLLHLLTGYQDLIPPDTDVYALERLVASRLAGVFVLAHPHALGADLCRGALDIEAMDCLEEGALSFSKEISGEHIVRNALGAIVDSSIGILVEFVDTAAVPVALGLCPVFVHFCLSSAEDTITRASAEALQRALERAGRSFWAEQSAAGVAPMASWANGILSEACDLVVTMVVKGLSDKTLLPGSLRLIFDILAAVCTAVGHGQYLPHCLTALCARVAIAKAPISRLSSGPELRLQDADADDEDDAGTLGRSGPLAVSFASEDWDDWDDDVQSDETTLRIFANGLRVVRSAFAAMELAQRIALARRAGRPALDFDDAIRRLADGDARKIQWVLDSF